MEQENLILNSFESTYDWLNNIKSEIFENSQLAQSLVHFQELSNDPLYFECYFKARDLAFYTSVYEKFLMLLRTAPVDRLGSFLSYKAAHRHQF